MYEYKKIMVDLNSSSMATEEKIEKDLEKIFEFIEIEAKEGWRFVQAIHLFPRQNDCMLLFERMAE